MSWTPERVAQLTKRWNDGAPLSQISREMGVSKGAISGKVDRLGLPARDNPCKKRDVSARPRSKAALAIPAAIEAAPDPLDENMEANLEANPEAVREVERLSRRGKAECRWPTGEDPIRFECKAAPVEAYPYCAEHCALSYVFQTRSGGARRWRPEDAAVRQARRATK